MQNRNSPNGLEPLGREFDRLEGDDAGFGRSSALLF
jgi:hypothetical protein